MFLVNWSFKRMTIKGEKVELPEGVLSCGSDCLEMGRSSSFEFSTEDPNDRWIVFGLTVLSLNETSQRTQ